VAVGFLASPDCHGYEALDPFEAQRATGRICTVAASIRGLSGSLNAVRVACERQQSENSTATRNAGQVGSKKEFVCSRKALDAG